ncbi:hypothetical protein ACX80W_09880 [Arthrobacter sp. TMN-37]
MIGGLTIQVIAMIEYSAIAGTIGAGGISYVAMTYGYQRFVSRRRHAEGHC